MAETTDSQEIFLVEPEKRGVIPLDAFHIPRRLKRTIRQDMFDVTCDVAFSRVINACSEPTPERENSWINRTIINLYCDLHKMGYAHSIECWNGKALVGGLYGLSLHGVFFGESMFSRKTDASKIALVHLVARLRAGGYKLLDTQFKTPHLERFGTIEIPQSEFLQNLKKALREDGNFYSVSASLSGAEAVQLITQTS